jgi:hypothetical protein
MVGVREAFVSARVRWSLTEILPDIPPCGSLPGLLEDNTSNKDQSTPRDLNGLET